MSIKYYLTCEKIWNRFDVKNIGDCNDHYLNKDVLLLADVFEKFIDTCSKFFGLDPCHYFSSPRLSWDAMSKMTKIKFLKISDIDKYLLIEKGSRGGISYIAKRYAKANKQTTLKNLQRLQLTWIKIIYMVGQSVNIFLMKSFNG